MVSNAHVAVKLSRTIVPLDSLSSFITRRTKNFTLRLLPVKHRAKVKSSSVSKGQNMWSWFESVTYEHNTEHTNRATLDSFSPQISNHMTSTHGSVWNGLNQTWWCNSSDPLTLVLYEGYTEIMIYFMPNSGTAVGLQLKFVWKMWKTSDLRWYFNFN